MNKQEITDVAQVILDETQANIKKANDAIGEEREKALKAIGAAEGIQALHKALMVKAESMEGVAPTPPLVEAEVKELKQSKKPKALKQ